MGSALLSPSSSESLRWVQNDVKNAETNCSISSAKCHQLLTKESQLDHCTIHLGVRLLYVDLQIIHQLVLSRRRI